MLKEIISRASQFGSEKKADVLIMTAFLLIPFFLLVGLAIDYSKWQLARRALQNGIDAAAIAIAKQPNFDQLTEENAEEIAKSYIFFYMKEADVYTQEDQDNLTVNVTLNLQTGSVKVDATAALEKSFLQVFDSVSNN